MKKLFLFLIPLFLVACSGEQYSCRTIEDQAYLSGFAAGKHMYDPHKTFSNFPEWIDGKVDGFKRQDCNAEEEFEKGYLEGSYDPYLPTTYI